MKSYIFHRKESFYQLEVKDDIDAIKTAEANEGIILVTDMAGKQIWIKKTKYFKLSDGADVCEVIMPLETAMEWINNDGVKEEDDVQYTLEPVWLTDDEYKNLPEAEI